MFSNITKYHSVVGHMEITNYPLHDESKTVHMGTMVSPIAATVPAENHPDFHSYTDTQTSDSSSGQGKGSSIFGTGFNFVNSIVGAGIIGMPIAIKESGFFMGIFLLVLVAVLIDRSVILLVECGIKSGKTSLEDLSGHLFGRRGHMLATAFMFMYAYGAMVAYMLIIGDTVPVVLSYTFGGDPDRAIVVLIVALVIILPLCLLRDMSSLAYTSLLSISADFIMILFVLFNAPIAARKDGVQMTPSDYNFINYQIFEGIGTFSFAFVCQHNTFIVFDSMRHPTLHNWRKVAHGSMAIAASMCLALGLAGYMNFGKRTEGDILNNFSESDSLMLGARLLLAMTMVFTYPMELFVCRHALVAVTRSLLASHEPHAAAGAIVDEGLSDPPGDNSEGPSIEMSSPSVPQHINSEVDVAVEHQDINTSTHIGLTLGLWGSTVLIAVIFNDLRIVLALTGALAASMLGYILPGLIYFKSFSAEFTKSRLAWNSRSVYFQPRLRNRLAVSQRFFVPAFLLFFGVLALVVGVSTVLYDVAH